PTPRGGGLGLVIAVAVAVLLGFTLGMFLVTWQEWAIMGALLLIAILGFWDDHADLSSILRLILQSFCVLLCAWAMDLPNEIMIIGHEIYLPTNILWPIALLGGLFVLNVTNFMDGIDGICASQSIMASIGFFLSVSLFASSAFAPPFVMLISEALCAASIGFLFWNWPKASIFMGDVGSTFVGLTFVVFIFTQLHCTHPVEIIFLPIMPFIADGFCTLVRRTYRREALMKPHRSHLYQRLATQWQSHARVTLLYASMALLGVAFQYLELSNFVWPGTGFACLVCGFMLLSLYGKWQCPA
ncbi:MAG: glycosyltransferase family 4 protein, partial [Planctomycetes bacterium]|nr:glycosyltransferase family 4 protein [Planctomycetota bacterium]